MIDYTKEILKEFAAGQKGSDYSRVTDCIVAVHDFDMILVNFNIPVGRHDFEMEELELNAHGFVEFLKAAKNLKKITVFGHSSNMQYTDRVELLQEIAERKRSFFDNSDNQSIFDLIEIDPEPEKPRVHSVPKTRRDEIEEMAKNAASQGNSERQLVVRTDSRPRKENTGTIRFL